MRLKLLNAALILTSVLAYLEWGHGNSTFLLTAEIDIFRKAFTAPSEVLHPFTVIPLIGQLMLLATLFQQRPRGWLTFTGMGCIAVLLLLIFFIGIISLNARILASTLPFIITCVVTIIAWRRVARAKRLQQFP